MDLAAVNAFGRPVVQPPTANREALGLRAVADPREAQIPASPLAARNAADLRQSSGPRQSSSSGDTRNDEESTVKSRGAKAAPSSGRSRQPLEEDGGEQRGTSLDLSV